MLGHGLCFCALLVCAPGPEPAAPAWLTALFPYTGQPDEFHHRLSRVDAAEVPLGDDAVAGRVTLEFLYRGFDGNTKTGHARLYLPASLKDSPGAKVPIEVYAGYPIDEGGALARVRLGLALSHPHEETDNPMVRGPNLDIALLHALRQLPFIDDARVFVHGGSAGGYTTLMLAAETFPLAGAAPYVPPVNWGYNAAYFIHNRDAARAVPEGGTQPAQPVLSAVIVLAELMLPTFGPNFDSDAYLFSSPISQLGTITCPVQLVCSTADILVPVDQIGREYVKPRDLSLFPAGWTSALGDLMHRRQTRRTLCDLLPETAREVTVVPIPTTTRRAVPLPGHAADEGQPMNLPLPFSRERQWSIVVLDEGPIDPLCSHTKYAVNTDHKDFREWALGRSVRPSQLTLPKLERMMGKLAGKEYRPFTLHPENGEPYAATRLDFASAERADTLRGLRTFANVSDQCAEKLAAVYRSLPPELKLLGPALGNGTANSVREALSAPR